MWRGLRVLATAGCRRRATPRPSIRLGGDSDRVATAAAEFDRGMVRHFPSVIKLPHENSFELEGQKTHKNAAIADGFHLPVFLKILLVFDDERQATAMGT
jgi:hypothetical protein